MLAGLLDLYLSSISNRMNEVMKVLTIIATIFIPLTFLAGVYGMNFHFHPELELALGLPAVLGGGARHRRRDARVLPAQEMALTRGGGRP